MGEMYKVDPVRLVIEKTHQKSKDHWHRRHAIQLTAQLPENRDDAVLVLKYALELVDEWLNRPDPDIKTEIN